MGEPYIQRSKGNIRKGWSVLVHGFLQARSMSEIGSKRLFCGHCQEYVSKTVYHQHRDTNSKKWSTHRVFFQDEHETESFKPKDSMIESNSPVNEHSVGENPNYIRLLIVVFLFQVQGELP